MYKKQQQPLCNQLTR